MVEGWECPTPRKKEGNCPGGGNVRGNMSRGNVQIPSTQSSVSLSFDRPLLSFNSCLPHVVALTLHCLPCTLSHLTHLTGSSVRASSSKQIELVDDVATRAKSSCLSCGSNTRTNDRRYTASCYLRQRRTNCIRGPQS